MDKITKDTLKLITREREEMDAKSAGRSELEKTHSVEDTGALLAAINHGKGLKAAQPSIPTRQSPAPSMQQQQQQQQNKAPAAIKTNIKAANQVCQESLEKSMIDLNWPGAPLPEIASAMREEEREELFFVLFYQRTYL